MSTTGTSQANWRTYSTTVFAGGVPLTRDGVVVGGLGVSGGSGEQDQTVAEAGLTAL
ncbi:heme-binding protein [Nocardia sp. NBC_00565]|nr:heme-binding protein [Nocardia sp. NBC_00565]WUC08191.1 heme-binding protein [Nocardia sp. NBC_00565]